MNDGKASGLTRLLLIGAVVAAAVAVLVFPVAWVLDANAVEVIQVKPLDRAKWGEVDPLKRGEFDLDRELEPETPPTATQVADLYGAVLGDGAPIEVLFPPSEWTIQPAEKPDIHLLAVDKDPSDPLNANPFQLQTVWFLAPFVFGGALVTALFLFFVRHLLKKRAARPSDGD